jgi:hypothetical protein
MVLFIDPAKRTFKMSHYHAALSVKKKLTIAFADFYTYAVQLRERCSELVPNKLKIMQLINNTDHSGKMADMR